MVFLDLTVNRVQRVQQALLANLALQVLLDLKVTLDK
jgi:hypothetical protein